MGLSNHCDYCDHCDHCDWGPKNPQTLCGKFMCKCHTFLYWSIGSYPPWALVTTLTTVTTVTTMTEAQRTYRLHVANVCANEHSCIEIKSPNQYIETVQFWRSLVGSGTMIFFQAPSIFPYRYCHIAFSEYPLWKSFKKINKWNIRIGLWGSSETNFNASLL